MAEADYCSYEFPSVKQNPLFIRPIGNFQSDVIGMFERYGKLNQEGQQIPRTVLIMDTSKLEAFSQMVSYFGLSDHVEVVSRKENTPDEIETARTSDKPILVASPLFSIGLNFECAPEVLWCRFSKIEADTSQIIQTINRANRGDVACEVCIYAGAIDDEPFRYPPKQSVIEDLAAMIEDESEFSNPTYDMPMMLDRMAYNQYRNIERDTNKSLSMLKSNNAFQNYVVSAADNAPAFDKKAHKQFGDFVKVAVEEYDRLVYEWCNWIGPNRQIMQLLDDAERLAHERRNNYKSAEPRTEQEIESEELGIIMGICRLEAPSQARRVSMHKLQVLFGVREPWLNDSLRLQNFRGSKKVSAGKLKELIHLVETLGELSAGELDGLSMLSKLNQDKRLKDGFLALASSERDLISKHNSFDKLATLRDAHRQRRTKQSGLAADTCAEELIVELFGEIGIAFEREKEGRKLITIFDKPIIPSNWNFPAMVHQLELFVESLKSLPDNQLLEWGWEPREHVTSYNEIATCLDCKSFYLGRCLRGNGVDFTEWGITDLWNQANGWKEGSIWSLCSDFAQRRSKPSEVVELATHKI